MNIDVDTIGVGTRRIEGMYATIFAEAMHCCFRAKLIRRENQAELVWRYNKVQYALFRAVYSYTTAL